MELSNSSEEDEGEGEGEVAEFLALRLVLREAVGV